jgi:hypothetical protein
VVIAVVGWLAQKFVYDALTAIHLRDCHVERALTPKRKRGCLLEVLP